MRLKVAIISDLHCHRTSDCPHDSYLRSDMLRHPVNNHPIESLIGLIEQEGLEVDLTLCPGDITNKSDRQGFISGWDFCLEVHHHLNSKQILATLGNHDADSRNSSGSYSFEVAKGIRKGFPINDERARDTFWSKGCAFVESEDYLILVINSSHFHHNVDEASSGRVDDPMIDYVESYLSNCIDNRIKVAMSHHHPIDHSRLSLGEHDKIVNSERLLEVLGKYRFDLFVHGHKHDPLLRYYQCTDSEVRIPILSSGSFSATTNTSFTSKRNNFHIIELIKNGEDAACAVIKTWTFLPTTGWQVNVDDAGFHPYTGFGYAGTLQNLADRVASKVGDSKIVKWESIESDIPEVRYLIPMETVKFETLLKQRDLILSGRLFSSPEIVSKI